MTPEDDEVIKVLLHKASAGDKVALDRVTEILWKDLRQRAGSYMAREACGHTLQPTAVVNEAYMRFRNISTGLKDRAHFMAVAARNMRLVLVDHARAAIRRGRRGGQIQLPNQDDKETVNYDELLALDAALTKLHDKDPDLARVVELRYFCDMTDDEIAIILNCSERTVRRYWEVARAWLAHELRGSSSS